MPASTAAHQLCFACHANAQEEDLKPFYNMTSVRICVFLFSHCCGNAHRMFPTLSNLPKQRSAEFSYVPLFAGANFGDEKPEKGSRGRNTGQNTGWLKAAQSWPCTQAERQHARSRSAELHRARFVDVILPHLEAGAYPARSYCCRIKNGSVLC